MCIPWPAIRLGRLAKALAKLLNLSSSVFRGYAHSPEWGPRWEGNPGGADLQDVGRPLWTCPASLSSVHGRSSARACCSACGRAFCYRRVGTGSRNVRPRRRGPRPACPRPGGEDLHYPQRVAVVLGVTALAVRLMVFARSRDRRTPRGAQALGRSSGHPRPWTPRLLPLLPTRIRLAGVVLGTTSRNRGGA
jgi:hypothetical protein